jgi:LytS/YehU family sensor histidine kinase
MIRWYLFYAVSPVLLGSGPAGHGSPVEALQISFRGVFQSAYLGYWIVILIYTSSDYHKHVKERELRGTELERLVSESRLKTLRAQLHPHFLFNALNTISAHVERSPRAARQTLDNLGEILRLSLAHSNDQEVPLAQEIAFVEHYLKIQKARFEERLAAVVNADPDTLNALVPTFILQPLVENAIRHGMSPRLEKSCVQVLAWRENGDLRLRVQDDGAGLPRGWDPTQNVGIGMSNTRERLRHLYGDRRQTFEILSEPGKGVRVDLRIPFREATLPNSSGAQTNTTEDFSAAVSSHIPPSAARDQMEATHYILS